MSWFSKLFNKDNERALRVFEPLVEKINSLENGLVSLSDEQLKNKTAEFKAKIGNGQTLDDIMAEAFAVVREAAKRTLKQRHFDVQLIGGAALHQGKIAEMKTGEGKTQVATLPAYLNALTGKGVHVVTVNDYLSRRDAVWMGQIYDFLGLSVAVINHDSSYIYDSSHKELDDTRDATGSFHVVHEFLRPISRREAYAADITYGTNHEFGFDYLRDNLEYDASRLRGRDFNFAIVDEVDSILIDEARTPLIISSATSESEDLYKTFASLVRSFEKDKDYKVEEKHRSVTLTDEGITKAEKALGIENIYTEGGMKQVHHLETAVRAKALYERDHHYVVKDNEVVIVDEFTGRLQPGRRWSEGLHQAIEAKEGVSIQKESRTFASITYQNYFRLYKKLAGMTGTALTSAEEFHKVYGLEVVSVPTNKPNQRKDHNDLIFQTEKGKFKAITARVKELSKAGQPVLVGTASIEKNIELSEYFTREGIVHQMLNAKNHEKEGEIIAQAGRKGAVTIATNMAGRGVDIKLGGNPPELALYEEVKKIGGLFVLGTERHEARRIDNQLRGRSGRQGDPGETQFFVSMEDSLMRAFASDIIKKMMGRFGIPEDQPVENPLISRSLESAQAKIEGFHFDSRKHVLEFDDVLNHQRKIVYERRRALLLGGTAEVERRLMEIAQNEDARKVIVAKRAAAGDEVFWPAVKQLFLETIDMFWVEHLEAMDYLRGSVNLRAYGQRDPLVEYKKEGLQLFKTMQSSVNAHIINLVTRVDEKVFADEAKRLADIKTSAIKITAESSVADKNTVGRNDPCPCGAVNPINGKPYKYKQCGLINAPHHMVN